MSQFTVNKIDAIGSTNEALREEYHKGSLAHGKVLWALNQTQGKGQRGAVWAVEANKNLTFSVFLSQERLQFSSPYGLNCCVALGIKNALDFLEIPAVTIKWPNDILSGDKKLGGILIENVYRGSVLMGSIVGVGLNVNQEHFSNLPQASSMRLCSGRTFVLEDVLQLILKQFSNQFKAINEKEIFDRYRTSLFSLNERRVFRTSKGTFHAKVIGVNTSGQLQLQLDSGEIKAFALKSVQWVY